MRARALLLLATLGAAPAAAGEDAWAALRELRARLEARPLIAEFRQEYLPAGFASGDSETGRLTLALPGCLRWDYDEPFPKSYLLCEETVWTWNPDEASGRRFTVDPEQERGLDLLRLGVERLAERYGAELVASEGGGRAVRLEPVGEAGEIADATLTLAADGGHLAALGYRDLEGNVTRFEFAGHRPAAAGELDLRPPDGLIWIDE